MGKGKIIIPLAVIVTIVIASVASYFLYQLITDGGNDNNSSNKQSFSRLTSGFNDLQHQQHSSQEAQFVIEGKKACDLNPGIRVTIPGDAAENNGSLDNASQDGEYYDSNNYEANQIPMSEGSEE